MADIDAELRDLRESLLRRRPGQLRPDQGDQAFDEHVLLASAVHRASRLDVEGSESETAAWVRYFVEHFPAGRNDPEDARTLFKQWRTRLLKDDVPGIPITHGQSEIHWERDDRGRLAINLEDMWDDFEKSVDHFVEYLRNTPDRREVVLRRWRRTAWGVEPFSWARQMALRATVMDSATSASIATSLTITPTPDD